MPIVVAGHIAIDRIIDTIDQSSPRVSLGGSASYSTIALTSLGYENRAVTKVGDDFPPIYADFLSKFGGVDVERAKAESFKTTSYRIDRTTSPRRMWLVHRCKPLSFSDFHSYMSGSKIADDRMSDEKTLILNPVAGEISLSLLDRIAKEFELVLVDSQGFVRRFSPKSGEVSLKSGLDISSLSGVDILKADREELFGWTATHDLEISLREISRFVDIVLLTSGPGEVDLYEGGRLKLRARPPIVQVRDSTGAGDIMLASFAAMYSEEKDFEKALPFSVCAATLAVRRVGIEKAILDRKEVQLRTSDVRMVHV